MLPFAFQSERIQYMNKASDYKLQLEELEKEFAVSHSEGTKSRPRRHGLSERNNLSQHDLSEENAKLKDDLQQCNERLRKYYQHCESLKEEKKNIEEAISSFKFDDISGNSLSEMVTSLCKKLRSIEEECDALANSEEKATEYLVELDTLREKHAELESQLLRYDEYKANLEQAQRKISTLLKEQESLRKIAENAKGSVSELQNEKLRQLQYLENENLQLMEELKSTKRELQESKVELNAVQRNVFSGEATEELQGLGEILESSRKHVSTKRAEESFCSDNDKENINNRMPRINSSMKSPLLSPSKKKRKSVNPFSSVKKAARRTRKALADDSPKTFGLGEGDPTEDATSECKQS